MSVGTIQANAPESITVEPFTTCLGAEVKNVDLSKPLPDAAFRKIHEAFLAHAVLVFKGQTISIEQHIAFSRRFGDLEVHPQAQFTLPDHPEIFVLANVPVAGKRMADRGGRTWHSDLSYMPEPSLGSLLYGVECPPVGGDTEFASMYAAYDALPQATKDRITGLKAVHDRVYNYERFYSHREPLTPEQKAKVPPVEQPLVRTHPETGRKALYVSDSIISHIVGMPQEEGLALVEELAAFATQPAFRYVHKWEPGDLVFWDNRCVMHRATEFDEEKYRRVMYRTTLKGDRPF